MEQTVGNIERARQLFEQGTRADPTNAPTYQAWALMEQKVGNIERARQLFEQGTRADPTHAPTYQAWALMELREDPEAALKVIEKGLTKVSDSRDRARLLCARGSAYAKLHKYKDADESFERALKLEENNPFIHYYFACQSLERQGKRAEAIQHYERALKLGPRQENRQKIERALKRLRK
jgi:tetratricopeptide (TPR) repeat protein